jgi:methyl-accepting chemotaxis protein
MASKVELERKSNSGTKGTRGVNRILPAVLRIGGGVGFLFHILVILALFIVRPRLVEAVLTLTTEVETQIEDLDRVISDAGVSLTMASKTLDDTGNFLLESKDLLGRSSNLLRSVGELVGEDATKTILSTQDALEAAIPGSQTIDSMLKALSVLEPLTGFSYDPEKTLSQGLEEVAASLEPLPESLVEIRIQLEEAADELDGLAPGLDEVEDDLSDFSEKLDEISTQMEMGKDAFQRIQDGIERVENRVAPISWISTIILSVFFAFGAISQLSAFLFGKQNKNSSPLNHESSDA